MLLIAAFALLLRRYGSLAAPLPFTTSFDSKSSISPRNEFTVNSERRSIWDILQSCLATTFTCTWVSVHPNVPFLGESRWVVLRRRLFLMLLSLLAPEIMIMWAFKQWRGAVMIRETVNKACPHIRERWTMVHAHFLQMGGFRLVCTTAENRKGPVVIHPPKDKFEPRSFITQNRYYFIPPQISYRSRDERLVEGVIGLEAFRELLKQQLIDFPEVSKDEIGDKSKGDILSKGIALLQIGWFLLQLVARSRENLAITELELTTAALAALNFAMYLCWWNKPQDVRCPVLIRTKATERILAETEVKDDWEIQDASEDFEYFRLRYYLKGGLLGALASIGKFFTHVGIAITNLPRSIRRLYNLLVKSIQTAWIGVHSRTYDKSNAAGGIGHEKSGEGSKYGQGRVDTTERVRALVGFMSWFIQNLLVKSFVMPYLPMFLPVKLILSPQQIRFYQESFGDAKEKMTSKPLLELFFDKDDMVWIMSMMFYSERADAPPLFYSSAIGGAIFGSIHCFAWNFEFPSIVERSLWRAASFSIVGVCICVVPGIFIHNTLNRWGKAYDDESHARRFWLGIRTICELIPCIIYPIARSALLLLAISSLRNIPFSALDAVQWVQLIPHI